MIITFCQDTTLIFKVVYNLFRHQKNGLTLQSEIPFSQARVEPREIASCSTALLTFDPLLKVENVQCGN